MAHNPTAFISYAWEQGTKDWAKDLATNLRGKGVDAKLDVWELVPGDRLPLFMEKAVRENDYVLIILTPKYKIRSENRVGGVGYEGDIMTAEVLQTGNHRKFIPILKEGSTTDSIPSWLNGKYFLDFSSNVFYKTNFTDLIATLFSKREMAPPLGNVPDFSGVIDLDVGKRQDVSEGVKIIGIIVDEVTYPDMDGSTGSALYTIPFRLNKWPDELWKKLFLKAWEVPPKFSLMHRPEIASVSGNEILLNGTSIEEVELWHKDTLKHAVQIANEAYTKTIEQNNRQISELKQRIDNHKQNVVEAAKRIGFD